MGSTLRFLGDESEGAMVLSWFRQLQHQTQIVPTSRSTIVYFPEFGPIVELPNGRPDATKSPVVNVFSPRRIREVFLTVGEVHFLSTPLPLTFPRLYRVRKEFGSWLRQFPVVFPNDHDQDNHWNHYLEGTLRNYDPPIHAMPKGKAALEAGHYFVGDRDTDSVVDKLCRTLRLRGVNCQD